MHECGLSPQRPALIQVWDHGHGGVLVAAKGAPETIVAMCAPDAPGGAAALETAG